MTRIRIAAAVLTAVIAPAAHAQFHLRPVQVTPNVWRGKAPYFRQSYEELQELRDQGVRTVIDLRGNQPFASAVERRRVEAMGMTYRKVPFHFNPFRDWDDRAVLAAMANAADHPVYVHCNVDKDRTSVAVAGFRVKVLGWDPRAAEAEAREAGLRRVFFTLNRYVRDLGK
jgi:tyrosine-protein phosphatase SIW14